MPPCTPTVFARPGIWPPNDRYACVSRLKADRPCVVLPPSSVDFSKYDVLRADDRHHVGEHMAATHFIQRCNMGVTGRAYLHAKRLVGAVGNEIHAELALGMLHRRIGLARRHAVTFGEKLEVMNQRFHIGLHDFALGRHHFEILGDHRARIGTQPVDALLDDAIGLAHFLHPHQVTIITIAFDADRNVEVLVLVLFVSLFFAYIPFYAVSAQYRTGEAVLLRALGRHHADADGALLPDAVVGEQGFVFVYIGRKAPGEVFDEVEQRTLAIAVHAIDFFLIVPLRRRIVRHDIG